MSRRIRSEVMQAAGGPAQVDGYFDRVIKYIPSDVVGAWVAVTGIINSSNPNGSSHTVMWIAFIVGLCLTALWTWRQTSAPGQPVAATQIGVSTVAFAVWVFALGGPFATIPGYQQYFGSLILIGYTLFVAIVVPKQ
jgi:hypothetical protein